MAGRSQAFQQPRWSRLRQLFTDSVYRSVLFHRVILLLLSKANRHIKYIGCEFGAETTFLFANDKAITPYTLSLGGFQKGEFLKALELCRSEGLPLGGIFFDIGANIGTHTVYALHSQLFTRAVSFEPARANQRLLRANLIANGLEDHVTVVGAAVSDQGGEVLLAHSDDNCGDHRVLTETVAPSTGVETVRRVTLDGYIAASGIRAGDISMLWIDTQGHEGEVLAGARQTLALGIPMVVEIWPKLLKDKGRYAELMAALKANYTHFFDTNAPNPVRRNMSELEAYCAKHLGRDDQQTDFLLLSSSPRSTRV